jgi:hypothetical protein
MSDYERYADYNETEDDAPRSGGAVMLILKILTVLVCAAVVGILVFRLVAFNVYPESVRTLYFNDTLTAHYKADKNGFAVKTQSLRYPYDDEDLGNFFCDHLYVIEAAGQLQITVRYNVSTVERIESERGIELDENSAELFVFRLVDNYGSVQGELVDSVFDSQMMYRYVKLVFDGVRFDADENGKYPEWIRLETFLAGDDTVTATPYMNPIYENNADHSEFITYEPKEKELPQ